MDPGCIESYGMGKGQKVVANAIHDIVIAPKRWGSPDEYQSQGRSCSAMQVLISVCMIQTLHTR